MSRGQSLVEVTIASAALVFGLVSVISALLLSVRSSALSNTQTLATQHAQEVVEKFRQFQRELGWESFYGILSADGSTYNYCLTTLPTTTTEFRNLTTGSCSFSSDYTGFIRQAAITVDNANQVSMTTTVTWRDGTNTRTASVKHIFTSFK